MFSRLQLPKTKSESASVSGRYFTSRPPLMRASKVHKESLDIHTTLSITCNFYTFFTRLFKHYVLLFSQPQPALAYDDNTPRLSTIFVRESHLPVDPNLPGPLQYNVKNVDMEINTRVRNAKTATPRESIHPLNNPPNRSSYPLLHRADSCSSHPKRQVSGENKPRMSSASSGEPRSE